MSQVKTKGINLAGKCMIMAAVAYNLKKLIKGAASIEIKKRLRKPTITGCNGFKNSLLEGIIMIETVMSCFKISDKSKWLNNHLLCKLNYSAI